MKKILFLMVLIIAFTACTQKKEEVKETEEIKGNLEISNAWFRPGLEGRNSALFFIVNNNSSLPDTLFAAESDLAKVVEVHESFKKENDMMGMRHVEEIIIPANSKMELKPGGYHVMLIGLVNNLELGNTKKVTVEFKQKGKVEVSGIVKNPVMANNSEEACCSE